MFNTGIHEGQPVTGSLFVVEPIATHAKEIANLASSKGVKTEVFSSADEFMRLWIGPKPGCVLLDLGPAALGEQGLQLQASLAEDHEYLCVLAAGFASIETAFQSSKLGAFGFVENTRSAGALIPLLASGLAEAESRWDVWQRKLEYRKRLDSLTRREAEVYCLLIDGLNNREMAVRLDIAVGTIEKHKSSVLSKVEAKNPAHLLSEAFAAMGTLRIDDPSPARSSMRRHSIFT